MHGGPSPGAPKGNRNAFKHGRYTAKALDDRRKIAALLRVMRDLAREVAGRKRPVERSMTGSERQDRKSKKSRVYPSWLKKVTYSGFLIVIKADGPIALVLRKVFRKSCA
jgi:hypothetical protein